MDFTAILDQVTLFFKDYAWNVLAALLVFVIGKWIARRLTRVVEKLLTRQNVDQTLIRFFENIIYYALLIVVLMATADQLGIDTNSFLAIFGAAGLAVGLALKDSLGNIASGVMLVFLRPFKIGDVVTTSGITGKVEAISIFNSTFLTFDNQRMIIPNGQITNGVIVNITANSTRRLDMVFGISYGDDILKAKQVFAAVLATEPRILPEPAPLIVVSELGDSSVNFNVRPWVKTDEYWDIKWSLTEKIKIALDEAGITIPFPQREIHVNQK